MKLIGSAAATTTKAPASRGTTHRFGRSTNFCSGELIVGATVSVEIAYALPRVVQCVPGAKFKIINGYPGSSGVMLAMERGEAQGFCSSGFATMELNRPD